MAKAKEESGKKPAKKAAKKVTAKKSIGKKIKDAVKTVKEKVSRKKTAVISAPEPVEEKAIMPVRASGEEPNY